LIEYYNDKANTIQSQAREASIHDNKSDIGTLREDYLFDFLETHIPTRCNVIKGGFVFDSTGSKSSQIDLMVCNDQTFQFKKSGYDNKTKSFKCVEGCYAVISVKSYLTKLSLIDSLQNLASVSTTKIKFHSELYFHMMEIIWRLYSNHARYIMTIVKKLGLLNLCQILL
jgi:hypothetical protein